MTVKRHTLVRVVSGFVTVGLAGLISVDSGYFLDRANAAVGSCSPATSSFTSGGVQYAVLAFQASGTCEWTVPSGVSTIDYLLVGGGGGGGADTASGGGGGGLYEATGTSVTSGSVISVIVGAGGAGGIYLAAAAGVGQSSQIVIAATTTTATGGAGGITGVFSGAGGAGGTGTTTGGTGGIAPAGIGLAGASGSAGASSAITGASVTYGGGGGGGIYLANPQATLGPTAGGAGGGGAGAGFIDTPSLTAARAGTANTGGGGGGGSADGLATYRTNGASGGSGLVVIRYVTPTPTPSPTPAPSPEPEPTPCWVPPQSCGPEAPEPEPTPVTPAPPPISPVAIVPVSEAPGETRIEINGNSVAATVSRPQSNEFVIAFSGLQLGILGGGVRSGARPPEGSPLVLTKGSPVIVSGTGAEPNSTVQAAIFSNPVTLPPTAVLPDGRFETKSALPTGLRPGNHTFQVTGRLAGGEPFVISTGVRVVPRVTKAKIEIKFLPASAVVTQEMRRNLRAFVNQSEGKRVKELRVDGRTFFITAEFARYLARERVQAITSQLRQLGVKGKIEKRITPTKAISDEKVRTYSVALKARPQIK